MLFLVIYTSSLALRCLLLSLVGDSVSGGGLAISESYFVFPGSPMYIGGIHSMKLQFSCINLSYMNLIIRPAKELKKEEDTYSSPP